MELALFLTPISIPTLKCKLNLVCYKAGNIQYYVDGEDTGNGQMAVNQFPEDGFKQRVNMGQDGRCDGEFGYYEGLIDEFAVFNRLLTKAEVKQNANSDRGLSVEPADRLPLKWSELKVQ